MLHAAPEFRIFLPFLRTPTNLIRDFFAHTPGLNMLQRRFWQAIKEGGEQAAIAKGQMATGTILWVTAGWLASEGLITGGRRIVNVGDPINKTDAATKDWVEALSYHYEV